MTVTLSPARRPVTFQEKGSPYSATEGAATIFSSVAPADEADQAGSQPRTTTRVQKTVRDPNCFFLMYSLRRLSNAAISFLLSFDSAKNCV